MEVFDTKVQEIDGVPVIVFSGYLAKEGGEKLHALADPLLKARKVGIVIDMKDCKVLSSPGIAALMDLLMIITDDYRGKLVLAGLDNSKIMFLKMTGVLPLAQTAATAAEAVKLAKL